MHYSYKDMPENRDKAALDTWAKEKFNQQETVEYHTMLEHLKVLEKWCEENKETEFFKYFQDAVIGTYCRAVHYKKKAWADKDELKRKEKKKWLEKALDVATAAPAIILPMITTLINCVEIEKINMPQFLAAVAVGAGISLSLGIFKIKKQEKEEDTRAATEAVKKHKYEETWIRHTLCDSRMRLALSKFAASGNPTQKDYDALVQSAFAILEQNLDQFAVNMCPNGMASR